MNTNPALPLLQFPVHDNYKQRAAKILGILQIVLGALILLCQTVVHGIASSNGYDTSLGMMPSLIILAGALGIYSASTKSSVSVISTMILSILSAVYCCRLFVHAINVTFYIDTWSFRSSFDRYSDDERVALHGIYYTLAALGIAELVVAIVASVFCCRAGPCGSTPQVLPSTGPMGPMVFDPHQTVTYPQLPQLQDYKEKI